MKTKIFFAIVIFTGLVIYLKGITVVAGVAPMPVPLSDMPWEDGKIYIWCFIIVSAGVFASILWWKQIYKKLFML